VRLAERMRRNRIAGVQFGEEAAGEVRRMLSEHAPRGGRVKREEDMLVLTWKGHGAVYMDSCLVTKLS
jgi:hypothetical protein